HKLTVVYVRQTHGSEGYSAGCAPTAGGGGGGCGGGRREETGGGAKAKNSEGCLGEEVKIIPSEKKEYWLHAFTMKVTERISARLAPLRILKDIVKEGKGRSERKNKSWKWEYERYDHEVLIHLVDIIAGMDRLEQSQNFIRTFPQPRSYEKKGITQHAWIEYHYTYYVVTFVSLFDIVLILTNTVFRLGNSELACKADLIMENQWVRQTPVKQALAHLDTLIKRHRQSRHLYVHRGRMPDIPFAIDSDERDLMKLVSLWQPMVLASTLDREMI